MGDEHDAEVGVPKQDFTSDPARRRVIAGAALALGSLATSRAGATSANPMTAEDVRTLLDLKPHPTCGFVRVTFVSPQMVPSGALPSPFEAGRPLGSALIFQVTPAAHVKLHRIHNDQFYHYYMGDPIEVVMLKTDGSVARAVVGPDLRAGQLVQLFLPGNTFHTARLAAGGQWFLGASTQWPGVESIDVEPGNLDELAAKYPAAADDLRAFAKLP